LQRYEDLVTAKNFYIKRKDTTKKDTRKINPSCLRVQNSKPFGRKKLKENEQERVE